MYQLIVLLSLVLYTFGAPLGDIPQCPVDQCGVTLSPTTPNPSFGLRHKAVRLRNDVDEANEAELVITFNSADVSSTTMLVGFTAANDDSTIAKAIVLKIPLGSSPSLTSSPGLSLQIAQSSFDNLIGSSNVAYPGATTGDNYVNTDITGLTSVVVTISVKYNCISSFGPGCSTGGETTIKVRSSSAGTGERTLTVPSVIGAPGDNVYAYIGAIGGDITIDSVGEACEDADFYGDGLYCVKNSENAPKPLECFVAIHVPGYDPTIPHWAQNNLQWFYDDAKAACADGSIVSGTVALASLHTIEENNAAVAAMKYSGCQTAWFGLEGIQGYNDYTWVDGEDCNANNPCNDNRLWRGRNDPNAYTDAEPSVGYMEVLIGDAFPACGYYFWADECRPVGKHPCAICLKYVTDAPTASPTETPTTTPTKVPSVTPTTSPSVSPSTTPTTSPTKSPSTTPTTSPTKSPTTTPTKAPTKAPTTTPTKTPTTTPTTSPTKAPTKSPSTTPSTTPTTSPSKAPTTTPTVSPSTTPTKAPTDTPTTTPTTTPTKSPSTTPTTTPTTSPTTTPSTTPTTSPSKAPTTTPTTTPTTSPSKSPSVTPTSSPSLSPSTPPTKAPSTTPTTTPTKSPTPSPTPETPCECQKGAVFPRDINLAPGQSDIYLYSAAFATYTIKDDKYAAIDITATDTLEIRLCYNSDCVTNLNSQFIIIIDASGAISITGYDKSGVTIGTVPAVQPTGITSITQITSLYMVWDNDEFVNVGAMGDLVIGLGKQLGANEVTRVPFSAIFNYNDDHKFIELVASSPNKEDGAAIEVCWFGSIQYPCETAPTDCDIKPEYLLAQYEGYKLNCLTQGNGNQICEWYDSSANGNNIDSQYFSASTLENVDLSGQVSCVQVDPNFPCDSRNTIAVKGTTTDTITIVSPSGLASLPELYTLFTVARYPDGSTNKKVIFGSDSPRFESGFGPNGEIGYAFHNDILITDPNNFDDAYEFANDPTANNFLLSADQRSMYRGNGQMFTVKTPTNFETYSPFKINPNGDSDFEILEILIFKVELTQEQVKCIEYQYFEPKYSVTPLGPQCEDIAFPIYLREPRPANASGSYFESFPIGDANECDNQCPDDTNVNCAGKQTLVNVRATKLTTSSDVVIAIESGAQFIGAVFSLDGAQEFINGFSTKNMINPDPATATSFPSNPNLASDATNPLVLINFDSGLVPISDIIASIGVGESILLTFKIVQLFNPAKTTISIYNFETLILTATYDALFDQTNAMFLRMGLDLDQISQEIRLDNFRKQVLCYTQSYVDYLGTISARNVGHSNIEKTHGNNDETNNNVINSNKFYLILFIITITINVIMIGFAIILWNKGAGHNMILFCNKSRNKYSNGYSFEDGSSSCDESDSDADILVPAKRVGKKNKKGYAAIVPVSESDME